MDILTKNLAEFQALFKVLQNQMECVQTKLRDFDERIKNMEENMKTIKQRKQFPCDQCSTILYTKHNFNRHKKFHEKKKEWF